MWHLHIHRSAITLMSPLTHKVKLFYFHCICVQDYKRCVIENKPLIQNNLFGPLSTTDVFINTWTNIYRKMWEMWALERQYPSQNSQCDRTKWLNHILVLHSHKWTIAAVLNAKGTGGNGCLHIMESFQRCLKTSHTQLLYCYKPMLGMAWKVDAGWSKHLPIWLGPKEVLKKIWNGRAQLPLAPFYYVHPYLWSVINAAPPSMQCPLWVEEPFSTREAFDWKWYSIQRWVKIGKEIIWKNPTENTRIAEKSDFSCKI